MADRKPEEHLTRALTPFQKVMIAAVIILLAAGGILRLYYSHFEVTRVKAELKQERSPGAALMVDVKGAVLKPGLISLNKGARVIDAVDAAGGFADGARKESLNLAAFVKDGEEIVVPLGDPSAGGSGSATGSLHSDSVAKLAPGQKVNINTASAEDLRKIPGVGPSYAERILEVRKQRGRFANIGEIRLVHGIGAGRFARLKDYITVDGK